MASLTDDATPCAPHGRRSSPTPRRQFTTEQAFVAEDRLVQPWRYQWDGGHVRGIDVIRVRDGKISAKLSYVKG